MRHLANMGAYMTYAGARLATYNFSRCFPTVYRVPHIDASVRCVFTHTTPTGPYRGAGRPEANYLMERLVEEAARVTGIDRMSLRKRNFIPRSAIPYKTDVQTTYDSGEFPADFRKSAGARGLCRFQETKARRRQAREISRLWRVLFPRTFRRRADRRRAARISRRRKACDRAWRAIDRTGTCDGLSTACR